MWYQTQLQYALVTIYLYCGFWEPVWQVSFNTLLSILNNITHIISPTRISKTHKQYYSNSSIKHALNILQWEVQNILINNVVELFSFIQSPKYIFVVKICSVSRFFFINILFLKKLYYFFKKYKKLSKENYLKKIKIFHKLMS